MTTIYWSDEIHICIQNKETGWTFPIRYPEGRTMFALGDGSLIEVTRKGDEPRVRVFKEGSSTYHEGSGSLHIDGDVEWISRAWDFASLMPVVVTPKPLLPE